MFLVLVVEDLVGLLEPFTFNFFSISCWGIDLDYCDIEWFELEMNRDHSVIFETAPKSAFRTLVDCEGYSISFEEFLPILVDIMVI